MWCIITKYVLIIVIILSTFMPCYGVSTDNFRLNINWKVGDIWYVSGWGVECSMQDTIGVGITKLRSLQIIYKYTVESIENIDGKELFKVCKKRENNRKVRKGMTQDTSVDLMYLFFDKYTYNLVGVIDRRGGSAEDVNKRKEVFRYLNVPVHCGIGNYIDMTNKYVKNDNDFWDQIVEYDESRQCWKISIVKPDRHPIAIFWWCDGEPWWREMLVMGCYIDKDGKVVDEPTGAYDLITPGWKYDHEPKWD